MLSHCQLPVRTGPVFRYGSLQEIQLAKETFALEFRNVRGHATVLTLHGHVNRIALSCVTHVECSGKPGSCTHQQLPEVLRANVRNGASRLVSSGRPRGHHTSWFSSGSGRASTSSFCARTDRHGERMLPFMERGGFLPC